MSFLSFFLADGIKFELLTRPFNNLTWKKKTAFGETVTPMKCRRQDDLVACEPARNGE